jgi:ABC-type oligopeptide transport system substrate-binding subunit
MSDCRRTAKLVARLAVLVIAAGTLASCEPRGAGRAPDPVTIGIAEPARLLPSSTVDPNGAQVVAALWTPLVTFDPGGRPVMAAAESITSSDRKVWTITLKSGWTFHNGESVTSDNYIRAWNNASYGPNAALGSNIVWRIEGYADMQSVGGAPPRATTLSGLRKVDDLTFTVTLASPFSTWETALGSNVFDPLPDAAFDRDGRVTKDFEQAPIGQGPFQMDGVWNHYRNIAVKRFPNYRGTRPTVSNINFRMYLDQSAMYDDLIAGRLDAQSRIPPPKLASAKDDLGGRLRTTPSSYIGFITVPNDIPAYTADIRRAISMAFDRKEITDKVFHGAFTPATSWVSPTVPGYRADTCGRYCDYDPTAARSLWTRAGGVPGNKLALYYDSDDGHREWVDVVCDQLASSLNVSCQGSPVARLLDLREQTEARIRVVGAAWSFDYPSIEDYLRPLYATGAHRNDGGYANPSFDAALARGDAASTQDAAVTAYQEAEDILANDMPVILTWCGQNALGYSTRMSHVDVDVFGDVDVVTLSTR